MTIVRNQPFHVQVDHDGFDTATYDLLVDGAVVATLPVAALQAGVVTFSNVIITTAGSHVLAVSAVGPGGQAASIPFAQDVVPGVPGAPTNLRVTVA